MYSESTGTVRKSEVLKERFRFPLIQDLLDMKAMAIAEMIDSPFSNTMMPQQINTTQVCETSNNLDRNVKGVSENSETRAAQRVSECLLVGLNTRGSKDPWKSTAPRMESEI